MNTKMKKYNKLVRDKIPDIIKADGGECKFHVAKKNEFAELLNEKVFEEAMELIKNPCAEEIADVLEVVEALARMHHINLDDIKLAKVKKKEERGGFQQMIVLDEASEEKPLIERDGSHVHLNMGDTETLHKDFLSSGDSLKNR